MSSMSTADESDEIWHGKAQHALLAGLARGDDISLLEEAVRRCATKGFTPDVAVLEVGVAALDAAGVDRHAPLVNTELFRHLPELSFRNNRGLRERVTYAIHAVAAMRAGVVPEILDDTYWWRTRDIVEYAVIAGVAYVRTCAERAEQSVPIFAERLMTELGLRG
jgi:hypothetical protein